MKHHKNLNKIKQRALWECISKVVLFIKMTYCRCASWVFSPLNIYSHCGRSNHCTSQGSLYCKKKKNSMTGSRTESKTCIYIYLIYVYVVHIHSTHSLCVCAFASISVRTTLKCLNLGLRVKFCFILMRILDSKFTMFCVFKKINTTSVCRSKCTK